MHGIMVRAAYTASSTNVKMMSCCVKLPSYIKMTELIPAATARVIKRCDAENRAKAVEAFSEPVGARGSYGLGRQAPKEPKV